MSAERTTTFIHSPADQALTVSDKGLLRGSLGLAAFALVALGLLYPLAGVGLGQALFPETANGSLIEQGGKILGSELVAQPFAGKQYFQPRPSAANYDPMAVAGSNQARTNPEMRQRVEEARAAVAEREHIDPNAVPGDLVTQSGGGIDPHISPEAAAVQIARVAQARGLQPGTVEGLVAQYTEDKQFGVLGQRRVNVLKLNLALDTHQAASATPSGAQSESAVPQR